MLQNNIYYSDRPAKRKINNDGIPIIIVTSQ